MHLYDRIVERQRELFIQRAAQCMRRRLRIDNLFLRQHIVSFLWSRVKPQLL